MALYIGLMSGTSLDAIDVAAVEISANQTTLKHAISHPIPDNTRQQLHQLMADNGDDTVDLLGEVDAKMGLLFAEAVNALMQSASLLASDITAIGSHGQTIRHRPDLKHAFTLQIGDASRIAEKTGIMTVTDFRRRDIAAGGQGAPLVPAFHRAIFGSQNENRCIVNIGGMANISYLPKNENLTTSGFDTGPGNVLLDYYCQLVTNQSYDKNGDWARSGSLNNDLFSQMLIDPYFSKPAPKSTGREYFNAQWLEAQIKDRTFKAEDIQHTLTELTAKTISDAIMQSFPDTEQLIVCGGGAKNQFLIDRLQHLSQLEVSDSAKFNLDADWVEAVAFAWLAHCTLNNIPANVPAVTGAHAEVVLGAIYPA